MNVTALNLSRRSKSQLRSSQEPPEAFFKKITRKQKLEFIGHVLQDNYGDTKILNRYQLDPITQKSFDKSLNIQQGEQNVRHQQDDNYSMQYRKKSTLGTSQNFDLISRLSINLGKVNNPMEQYLNTENSGYISKIENSKMKFSRTRRQIDTQRLSNKCLAQIDQIQKIACQVQVQDNKKKLQDLEFKPKIKSNKINARCNSVLRPQVPVLEPIAPIAGQSLINFDQILNLEKKSLPPPKVALSKISINLNEKMSKLQKYDHLGQVQVSKYLKPTYDSFINSSLICSKTKQQQLMDDSVEQMAQIMGKLMIQKTNQFQFRPNTVYAANTGFDIKPMEARFIRISLQMESGAEEQGPQQGPLIIYFSKDTFAFNSENITKDLDLKVYISKNETYPHAKNCDFRYDFSESDQKTCQIKIYPDKKQEKFMNNQFYFYIGIYSFSGLKSFGMIYGFGSKFEFSLKQQLMNEFLIKKEDFTVAPPVEVDEIEKLEKNKKLDFTTKTRTLIKLLVEKPSSSTTKEYIENLRKIKYSMKKRQQEEMEVYLSKKLEQQPLTDRSEQTQAKNKQIQEESRKMKVFMTMRSDILKNLREKLKNQQFVASRKRLLVKFWITFQKKAFITRKLDVAWKKAKMQKYITFSKVWVTKIVIHKMSFFLLRKGSNMQQRQIKTIRQKLTFFSQFMPSKFKAQKVLLNFLQDKNKLFQLVIRGRIFYTQMLNIQRKWKNVFNQKVNDREQYRLHIIEAKNKLKDLICFNQPLYKKFDWYVEEMSQIDFNDSHYVTQVICEELEYQDLLFKFNIFRWQNLYSEHLSETMDFEFLWQFIQKLNIIRNSKEWVQYEQQMPFYIQIQEQIEQIFSQIKSPRKKSVKQTNSQMTSPKSATDNGKKLKGTFAKIKLREYNRKNNRGRTPTVKKTIDKFFLDKAITENLQNIGIEPMILDTIFPPSSEIIFENIDFRMLLYRVLIKRKNNSLRAAMKQMSSNSSMYQNMVTERSSHNIKF